MSWLSDAWDTVSGIFDSSGGGTGNVFDWSKVIASAIPPAISGFVASNQAGEKLTPEQQLDIYRQQKEIDANANMQQIAAELALKKQYGILGGGGGGGGGQSTQQLINYYKMRDKYQGVQNAYEKAIASKQNSTALILQALNNMATSLRTK